MSDIQLDIPFHTQHWDLDNWQAQGFSSWVDAEYWQRSSCGVLCVQMAAEYFLGRKFTIIELLQQGQRMGAYTDATGWSHQGLVDLAKQLDLAAERRAVSNGELIGAIDRGEVPIVSIKWGFVLRKTVKEQLLFWKKYGGHLAVVTGYRMEGDRLVGFIVHHTSKILEQNWVHRLVPVEVFSRAYTGRAILIAQKNVGM